MDARRRSALALSCFYASLGHPLRVPGGTTVPSRLWQGPVSDIVRRLRLSRRDADLLSSFRRNFSPEQMMETMKRRRISMVLLGEADYPEQLAQTFDPPLALFIAGDPARLEEFLGHPRIAIVGSRAATSYGTDVAHLLGAGLGRAGVCIVSGLAYGVDVAAHKAALPEQGGTIAVLGSGPDISYPRSNRVVYDAVVEQGLVVSEYPPGTEPRPWRFPARNRIIAGLSDGVIVVEAAEKSGALITADFCLEAGREVFAVPGSIFARTSSGANRLIQNGAAIATSADDVLEALGFSSAGSAMKDAEIEAGLDEVEKKILRVLGTRPLPADIVAVRAQVGVSDVLTRLTKLELGGKIRFEPGRGYSR